MARTKQPPPQITLTDLASVERDRQLSTRTTTVYWAASASTIGRRYKVSHDEGGAWRCECTAASFGNRCSHVAKAELLHEVRWWEPHLLGLTPGALREMIPGKECQIRTGCDVLSAQAALLTIEALLICADEPLADAA